MPSNRDLYSNPKSSYKFPVADNVWHFSREVVLTDDNVIETDGNPYSTTYTPANVAATFKREGDTLKVRGAFLVVSHAATTAKLTLPFGLSIDFSKLPILAGYAKVGAAESLVNNNDPIAPSSLITDGIDTQHLFFSFVSAGFTYKKATGTDVAGSTNGTLVTFEYSVPILEWNAQ